MIIIYFCSTILFIRQQNRLKLEKVRLITVLQAERGSNVTLKERLLLDLSNKSRVDRLLVSNALSLNFLLLFLVTEELLLSGGILRLLFFGKVSNVELFSVNRADVDASRCGNNVAGVNTSERNTVNLERSGNEKSVILKTLKEDDSLTTETASQDDQDSSGNKRRTELCRVVSLRSALLNKILSWVPVLGLLTMLVNIFDLMGYSDGLTPHVSQKSIYLLL